MLTRIIELPRFLDERGNISFIEQNKDVPFEIRRVYWVYDVPGGESRDGHAYFNSQELIIPLSGCFDIIADEGEGSQRFRLDRSYKGLYVPPGTWRRIENFVTNSVALILSSTDYSENDYERDYQHFIQSKKK